jgi:hypothetical protein
MTFPVRSALFIASILPQVRAERERPAEFRSCRFTRRFRPNSARIAGPARVRLIQY